MKLPTRFILLVLISAAFVLAMMALPKEAKKVHYGAPKYLSDDNISPEDRKKLYDQAYELQDQELREIQDLVSKQQAEDAKKKEEEKKKKEAEDNEKKKKKEEEEAAEKKKKEKEKAHKIWDMRWLFG